MTAHAIASGIKTSAEMDAVTAFVDLPPQFPPPYQPGGHLEGQRTDLGTWASPALPHSGFFDAEDFAEAGDRSVTKLGAPYAVWYFPFLTSEQVKYLRDTFCPNGLSSTVTIRTWKGQTNEWVDYYGTLQFPQVGRDMTAGNMGWDSVTLKIVGLKECEAT
jgi:hypothetical protein